MASTESHKNTDSYKDQSGLCKRKYKTLQRIFSKPFTQKRIFKRFRITRSEVQCFAPTQATPDKIKIVDQIGPNAISGGFQKGSFKAWYHGPRSVDRPPKIATVKPQANGATIFLRIIELNRPSSQYLSVIVDQEKYQNR